MARRLKKQGPQDERPDLPDFIEPSLATLQASPPSGPAWVHELKLDGYRLQVHIRSGEVRLLTRRGHDWTARFGSRLAKALRAISVETAIIDGEVIVESPNGLPSFSALQEALSTGSGRFKLFAFDLLFQDDDDLRSLPLIERKALLAPMVAGGDLVRYSEHFEDGPALWRAACDIGAEGIVSKRRDAPYQSGRTKAWIKSKCTQRQEFVVAGYVPSNAVAHAIGSLVVGYHDDAGGLVHAGRVGTGYTAQLAVDLFRRLEGIRMPASPFVKRLARADARGVRFVRPELVAEVVFRGWSSDGLLRHASFLALREDKRPDEVKREAP